ncbi:MAG: fibronectin type III domain-containing protein, partial [Actinomycetes bacterium]
MRYSGRRAFNRRRHQLVARCVSVMMLASTFGAIALPLAPASADVVPGSSVPSAPSAVTAVAANGSATVSWTASDSTGGSAITSYVVTATPSSQTCTYQVTNPEVDSCTVVGLTNGTAYTFTVTATNAAGDSVASVASSSVVPAIVPSAPATATAVAGNASVTVSWTPPASDGGSTITSYVVTSSPEAKTCSYQVVSPETDTCVVTGLTNGTAYTFTVTATNGVGTGGASDVTTPVTPQGSAVAPSAPTSVSGVRGNASVVVSWKAPTSNGGASVKSYLVTSSPGAKTCSTVLTRCTVTGLTNGTPYTFTVTATNAAGTSEASAASAPATPAAAPAAPSGVTATSNVSGQSTISWA